MTQGHLAAPPYIRGLKPYEPGKPIEETKREYGLKRVIKLASNENPLGPSPKAVEALKSAIPDLHRYPDGSGYHLKNTICKLHGFKPEQILLGNGSDEVINLIVRALVTPGEAVITSKSAFIAYKIATISQGARIVETELTHDYRFDLNAMFQQIQSDEKIRIAFIANPNNPTGTIVTPDELNTFLERVKGLSREVLVVLDSAYYEYVQGSKDLSDPHEMIKRYENVMVTHTFSKIFGLGGLRLGYGIGRPDWIDYMQRIRIPFNVHSLGLAGGEAALGDDEFVNRSRETNKTEMTYVTKSLSELGIPFWKSYGNFLLIDCQSGLGRSGVDVYLECLKKGVIFRPLVGYGLGQCLRITIGTREENEFALSALESFRKGR